MKIKNVRVREKDIKSGKIIYVDHPFYGIEKLTVLSRPYPIRSSITDSLIGMFFDVRTEYDLDYKSVRDCGIASHTYNDRRTFFKLKQAEAYVEMMSNSKSVVIRHHKHEALCEDFNNDLDYYGDGYY